ncbi:MAG: 2-hydroxy-3-oxopropionate reductase [Cytophagaceae bacterium SCN 52-12]|nr:MAG: 2-hydroxy-3-oxopropionate reductase [Cytophagaceae bacterium SCN 52-12]
MEKVGFIGLGIMGKPMAINLLKAGFEVTILNSSQAAEEVGKQGARIAETRSRLASESDIVITMLPDSPEVEAVFSGGDNVLDSLKPGSLFIDMSTIAPAVSRKIYDMAKAKGVEALDAPVSGGQVGAEAASLSIMAGGTQEAFDRALPLFKAMGKNIVLIGGPGAGQTTKACNQLIVGVTIEAVAEAFRLAEKSGVDLARMREALLGGFAQSRILDLHGQRIIDKNFRPGFKTRLHKKDMGIVLDSGDELGLSLLAAKLVAGQMEKVLEAGDGDLDHSSLFLYV